jgi:hypothetical protein
MILVFFLLSGQASLSSQDIWKEASSAALGGAFVTRAGEACAGLNQAGLGWRDQHSVSLHHSRPYLLRELGQSSFSGQFLAGGGGMGILLSTLGIKGLRQSSFWLSYGMKLTPDMSAGVGIHLWNSSLPDQIFHSLGMGLALGIQVRFPSHWTLGAHVLHPASWSSISLPNVLPGMILSAGFSYTFLESGTFFSEIRALRRLGIILVEGLEWHLSTRISMRMGFSNKPTTFTWGISMLLRPWNIQFAFQYRSHSGMIPHASLSHAW